MASLGTFGAALRELDPDSERDEFDFFGQMFTVEGVIPGMLTIQLGALLAGKMPFTDGQAAIYEALRCALIAPSENGQRDDSAFLRFYRLAVAHRCDDEELTRLALNIAGYQVGKAPEPSPTSPPGEPGTSTSSNSPSSGSPDLLLPTDPSAG